MEDIVLADNPWLWLRVRDRAMYGTDVGLLKNSTQASIVQLAPLESARIGDGAVD